MKTLLIRLTLFISLSFCALSQSAKSSGTIAGTVDRPCRSSRSRCECADYQRDSKLECPHRQNHREWFFQCSGGSRRCCCVSFTVLQEGFEAEELQIDASARATPVKVQLRVAGLNSSVVVTGGRDAVEIDKSVVAVNAVDRTDIEVRNLRLIDQSLVYEEGLNVYRAKGAADTSTAVGMRGFAANLIRVLDNLMASRSTTPMRVRCRGLFFR